MRRRYPVIPHALSKVNDACARLMYGKSSSTCTASSSNVKRCEILSSSEVGAKSAMLAEQPPEAGTFGSNH